MSTSIMQERVDDAVSLLRDNVDAETGFLWTGGSEAQVIAHMLLESVDRNVPFLTIDTGNQFESVYEFREQFASEHEFDWRVRSHEQLVRAIQSERDPRGYHGNWNASATGSAPVSESGWTVDRSCGQLKTVPMREFIEDDGFATLVTGMKESDPTAPDDFSPVVERKQPSTHTRVNPLHDWTESHVWAYLKFHFVEYPKIYDEGYRHTDSKCCVGDDAIGEHSGEGFDPQLEERKDELAAIGYV